MRDEARERVVCRWIGCIGLVELAGFGKHGVFRDEEERRG